MCVSFFGPYRTLYLTKFGGRLPLALNLLACIMMLILIILRFYYVSLNTIPTSRVVFFIILSIYELLFIGLLVAAEFKAQRPRLYFDFLDSKIGRGGFIAFTMLLILEVSKAAEIILGIIVFSIALLGIIGGWGEGSDGVNAVPPSTTNNFKAKETSNKP